LKNIARTSTGWRTFVRVGEYQRTKRWKKTATPKQMRDWIDETRVDLRRLKPRTGEPGTLQADVTRYLQQVSAMPTREERERHLQLWIDALGPNIGREAITPSAIRTILQTWRQTLGAATCNKRRTALMHLFSVLDGKGARNPVRDVPKFRSPDPLPRGKDPHAIDAKLLKAPRCRSRASCRVLLWTGMRPSELNRAEREDLDLEHRTIVVRTAKGGRVRVVPLTPQAVSAWKEFTAAVCWKDVPQAAPLNRWLQKVTGMQLRVYDLRHSYGTALARQRARLDTIGSLMGHSSLELTKRYTLAAVTPDALSATARLSKPLPKKVPAKKSREKRRAS
jgi:integrase